MCGKTNLREIIGVEVQEEVADMAKRSAKLNNLEDKFEIINKNILPKIPKIPTFLVWEKRLSSIFYPSFLYKIYENITSSISYFKKNVKKKYKNYKNIT